jgi:hypothetical protein
MLTAHIKVPLSISSIGESMVHSPLEIKHQLYGLSTPIKMQVN